MEFLLKSVSKWVDRVIDRVKLLIECIRTGGNDNKSVIERLGKHTETISGQSA